MIDDVRRHRAVHADLPLPYDDLERRRRRTVEWRGIISRVVAIVWIVGGAAVHPSVALAHQLGVRPGMLSGCLALPLVAALGLGVLALRKVDSPRYGLLGSANLAVDTLVIIAVVVAASADRSVVVWPVLVLPVLLGAFRHQLPGALVAWGLTTAADGWLYAGLHLDAAVLYTGVGLNLTVAILTGLEARGQQRHRRELATIRAELRHQTLHDPLTGLANRRMLQDRLRAELRTGDAVTVLALDLDGFKTVNDTFGHAAGDELLQVVAGRLRAHARDGDLVARLGGDEFVVVLAGVAEEEAREIADRMRFALVAPIALEGNSARVDASVGLAREACTDPDSLLRAADADMYRVKHVRREADRAEHATAGRRGERAPRSAVRPGQRPGSP